MIGSGQKIYLALSPFLVMICKSRSWTSKFYVKVYVKVFKISKFLNPLINYNYICWDDRYESKILFSIKPHPWSWPVVQGHGLKNFILIVFWVFFFFCFFFLRSRIFWTLLLIWLIICMMKGDSPKFYLASSPLLGMTYRSRSST